jgi:hypothetical protein
METIVKRLVFVALCTVGLSAAAQQPTVSSPPPAAAPVPAAVAAPAQPAVAPAIDTPRNPPQFGLSLDAGVPDLVGLNAVFRPVHFVRVNGGLLYNGAGAGLRAGVTLIPFFFAITPTLTFEYGHYFGGNANSTLNRFGVDTTRVEPMLRNVAYDFYNGHVGLEIGSPNRFLLFLRGGLSHFVSQVNGSGEFFQNLANDPTLEISDFKVRATLPSAKLGFILYLG